MPCDSISTVNVVLEKMNPELLIAALTALKLNPRPISGKGIILFGNRETYDSNTGKMQMSSYRDVKEIKRAYSEQVVKAMAKKYGWTAKSTEATTQGKVLNYER